jgi:hypothetical protein
VEENERATRMPVPEETNQEKRRARVELCARIYEEAEADAIRGNVEMANEKLDKLREKYWREIVEEGRKIWVEKGEKIQKEEQERKARIAEEAAAEEERAKER